MGLDDVFEFDLVPSARGATIATDQWPALEHLLLHMHPARAVRPIGDPATTIRVEGFGGTEVAPAVLEKASRLAGTALAVAEAGRS